MNTKDRESFTVDELIQVTTELSRIFAVGIRHACERLPSEAVTTFETCWKSLVFLIDTTLIADAERQEAAVDAAVARTWRKASVRA
jgi:hypothetical protein